MSFQVSENVSLPRLDIDDFIIFENMGAYTLPMASCFNGIPLPKIEYFIEREHLWVRKNRLFLWELLFTVEQTVIYHDKNQYLWKIWKLIEYFVQWQERHKRNGYKQPAHQKYRKITIFTDVHSFGEIHLFIYAEFAESRYLFLELRFTDRKINKIKFWIE